MVKKKPWFKKSLILDKVRQIQTRSTLKAKIARHNAAAHAGQKSYFLKMNNYGDLLHHEFTGAMNGYDYAAKVQLRSIADPDKVTWIAPENVDLPESVDWRAKGSCEQNSKGPLIKYLRSHLRWEGLPK